MGADMLDFPLLYRQDTEIFVFDLDNTLHRNENEYEAKCEEVIVDFLTTKHGEAYSKTMKDRLKSEYSSLLKGVLFEKIVSYDELKNYIIKDVKYEEIFKSNEDIIKLLKSINKPCFLMSNSSKEHIKRVLKIMGIEEMFVGVFYVGFELGDFTCKPSIRAYTIIKMLSGAEVIHFFDDKERNTVPAEQLGWKAYLVKENNLHDLVASAVG